MADKSSEQIGIVGVGRMGLAMLKHLVKAGYRVTACDVDQKQIDAARKRLNGQDKILDVLIKEGVVSESDISRSIAASCDSSLRYNSQTHS